MTDVRGRSVGGGLSRWLSRVAPASARGSVVVALLSDARARDLNRRFLRLDYATDVLSFPNPGADGLRPPFRSRARHLGDIVIAKGVARRQARAAGHDQASELKLLALHGLLHLLGYDHHRDGGRMARLERRLRRKGGLTLGLIERSASPRPSSRRASRRNRP